MKRKIIYLVLALCLPIAVFIFLRTFGENEFDIPVYYKNGIDESNPCMPKNSGQYFVSDSFLKERGWRANVPVIICTDSSKQVYSNLIRLREDFDSTEYQLIYLSTSNSEAGKNACLLLLEKPWTTVLLDAERRIRGYYTPTTLDETDRLGVELKILLKKYGDGTK